MNKLKVALCISGHFRCFGINNISVKNHILNNQDIECDIFIHTWDAIDRNRAPGFPLSQFQSDYNPTKIVIEKHINFAITREMRVQNFNNRDINGLLSMFYKIERCNQLKIDYEKEKNFKYDCVIRLRADTQLHQDLPINSNINLSKIHIPQYGDYGGLNDQMAFSNSHNMDIYSSIYSNIYRYLRQGMIINPEFFVNEVIKENNIALERPSIDYSIIWANGASWNNQNRFDPANLKKMYGQ